MLSYIFLPLNIETGRFRNQALEERLCTLCESNEIEDESHFLFKCSLYDELRSEWVSRIVNKTANFLELDKINKFKVIFDTHHRITAKFIFALLSAKKGKFIQDIMCCVNICCVYA